MGTEKELSEIIRRLYGARSDQERISPSWLATEAMLELDPDRVSPNLVYGAAHLELRQVARGILRKIPEDKEEQHDLFPDLQKRYPVARSSNEEPEYVLLEKMTEEDVSWNVHRLRTEGNTKLRKADALEAWWEDQAQTG